MDDAPGKDGPTRSDVTKKLSTEEWVAESIEHLHFCLENHLSSDKLRTWPEIPKQTSCREEFDRCIDGICTKWDEYWKSSTATQMVLIQKGIEQIYKFIKRPSNTRCFLLSEFENNNRYTRMIKEIWEHICEDFPPTAKKKIPDTAVAEDDNVQGKDEQECQKDTSKCVPSLTSSSEEKPAEHFQINDNETHLSEMEKWFLDILNVLHCNMENEKTDIVQILDQHIQPSSSTLVIITKRLKMRLCKGRHQIWNKHLSEDQNDTLKKLTVLHSMYVLEPILISKPQKQKKGLARKMKIIKESLTVREKKELQKVEGDVDRSDKSSESSDKNTVKILHERCQLYEELFQWTSTSVKESATNITKFEPEEEISNQHDFTNVIRSMEEVVAASKRAQYSYYPEKEMTLVSSFIKSLERNVKVEERDTQHSIDPEQGGLGNSVAELKDTVNKKITDVIKTEERLQFVTNLLDNTLRILNEMHSLSTLTLPNESEVEDEFYKDCLRRTSKQIHSLIVERCEESFKSKTADIVINVLRQHQNIEDINIPELPKALDDTIHQKLTTWFKDSVNTLSENVTKILEVDSSCDMFKANVMDDISEFIRGKKKASDMEPPHCISKYDPDTQRKLNKWFYKIRKILNDMEKESSGQKRKITEYTEKIRQYEEHREELLNRLSKVAGAKLKDNNPNITDLSDPNRPLKIAEQFSELYDKEWTSTLEHLMEQEKMDEEQAIVSLLKTVKDCYSFCSKESENQVSSFLMCKESDLKKMNRMQSGELQHLHEIRKSLTDQSIPKIKEKYSNKKQAVEGTGGMESYVEKCIEISWYMVIQNPPVYMSSAFKKGDPLDKNLLKPYTKSGDTIDFLVWPVLYLWEGGSVLSKGVAQPTRKPRRRPVTSPEQKNITTDEQESSSTVTPLQPQRDGKKKSKNEGS